MSRTPDLVVLLPGISGSVLSKDGVELWGTTSGAISRAILTGGESIRDLQMTEGDSASVDLGDGVSAPRLVPDLHMIPGLWKIDGYTKISRRLIMDLDLKRGVNYHEFPYDWRRDNRVAARRLLKFAQEHLRAWQRESDNPQAKLILIAHSMGGLVARYFIEVLGGWTETRALVTMGTPYFGSLNALGFLVNGYAKGIGPLRVDYSDVLASFTSVYQLLPTYPCVDMGGVKMERVADLPDLAHVDTTRAKDAHGFHQEILDAQAKNANDEKYNANKYKYTPSSASSSRRSSLRRSARVS